MTRLAIAHFNDVYRVSPQKLDPHASEVIDVTQFAAMLDDVRAKWVDDGTDGLSLFSGDLFSPSVESSVTRGSHMVPVINTLAPEVSLTGNHDFDFGYPHLTKLMKDTTFPWLLSNITDTETGRVPGGLKEFVILEKAGLRIGIIGLVEKDWISTVSSWPQNFVYKDMAETGLQLSKDLRDPEGEHRCDLIIALTHCRIPNDIALAKALHATSPKCGPTHINQHGVDLLLGGHDHLYYVSEGVNEWKAYDITAPVLGAESGSDDILLAKSGTDFRDLSNIELELSASPSGSIRRQTVTNIKGEHLSTSPTYRSHEGLKKILEDQLSNVSRTLHTPVCVLLAELDVRSQFIRLAESAAGDWFADIVRHSYDDALCLNDCGGADGVFICAGTLRGDSLYSDVLTLGNIMEILPFEDPIVVIELDGASLWQALESSLSTWPAQEGRFPVISGFRVSWNSSKPPGSRLLQVTHLGKSHEDDHEVDRNPGGRMYKVVTRQYMADGHDGFEALKDKKFLVDDENGQMMSTLVRRYLMGCHYVNKMARLSDQSEEEIARHLHKQTQSIIQVERASRKNVGRLASSRAVSNWHRAFNTVRDVRQHFASNLCITNREHMSGIDAFDGEKARKGLLISSEDEKDTPDEDLLRATPSIDGRLKDEGSRA
ncbi:Metallo-dependent phosphatase [Pterulicium gracile]|uniref:Metallo-dependent phosphatase n=1 Tax=Pterulicium gracile TaxID=1884261 RepID=A0A5C3R7N3_9AGAR|nr:Metallo-dependent phosphatase [Pterula gracilis]